MNEKKNCGMSREKKKLNERAANERMKQKTQHFTYKNENHKTSSRG